MTHPVCALLAAHIALVLGQQAGICNQLEIFHADDALVHKEARMDAATNDTKDATSDGAIIQVFKRDHCKTSCPFAVSSFGTQCELMCVDMDGCAGHQPEGHNCKINGCKSCNCSSESSICTACFEDWELIDGPDGTKICEVANAKYVLLGAHLMMGLAAVVCGCAGLLLLVNICHCLRRRAFPKEEQVKHRYSVSGDQLSISQSAAFAATAIMDPLLPHNSDGDPDDGLKEWDDHLFSQAWHWAKQTTIAAMATRRAEESKQMSISHGHKEKKYFAQDLGVGLVLFFETQKFLIVISAMCLTISYTAMKYSGIGEYLEWLGQENLFEKCTSANIGKFQHGKHSDLLVGHGWVMATTCAILFACLFISCMLFAKWGMHMVEVFDDQTNFSEDYTLTLKNVPRHFVSEKRLKLLLEEHWRCRIYGVCIAYDWEQLGEHPKLKEKGLEGGEWVMDFAEHMREMDDFHNNWCTVKYGPGRGLLQELLKEDLDILREVLLPGDGAEREMEGRLMGSGTAFVTFHTQGERTRIVQTCSGIHPDMLKLSADDQSELDRHWAKEGTPPKYDPNRLITIAGCQEEPAGMVWENIQHGDPEGHGWWFNASVLIVMLAIAVLLSQVFFVYLIEPYTKVNAFIDEKDPVLKLAFTGLLGVNVTIQCLVLIDGYMMKYQTLTKVDSFIYKWNTVLITLQTVYQVVLFSSRGMDTDNFSTYQLRSMTHRDALIESRTGDAVKEMTSFTLFFFQYVLNELCLGVAMVVLNLSVLWFFFSCGWGNNKLGEFFSSNILIRWSIFRKQRPGVKSRALLTARETEINMRYPEFLPSMEYTWVIAFPAIAFMPLFLVSDASTEVFFFLTLFALFFFAYQRYCNLWTMKAASYNSSQLFKTVVLSLGFLIGVLPAGSAVWLMRLGLISVNLLPFAAMVAWLNSVFLYHECLRRMGFFVADTDDSIDTHDAGYAQVIESSRFSWWCMNPMYVIKNRYLRKLKDDQKISQAQFEMYECQDADAPDAPLWPAENKLRGVVEVGMPRIRYHSNRVKISFKTDSPLEEAAKDALTKSVLTLLEEKIASSQGVLARTKQALLAGGKQLTRKLTLGSSKAWQGDLCEEDIVVMTEKDGRVAIFITPYPPPDSGVVARDLQYLLRADDHIGAAHHAVVQQRGISEDLRKVLEPFGPFSEEDVIYGAYPEHILEQYQF